MPHHQQSTTFLIWFFSNHHDITPSKSRTFLSSKTYCPITKTSPYVPRLGATVSGR